MLTNTTQTRVLLAGLGRTVTESPSVSLSAAPGLFPPSESGGFSEAFGEPRDEDSKCLSPALTGHLGMVYTGHTRYLGLSSGFCPQCSETGQPLPPTQVGVWRCHERPGRGLLVQARVTRALLTLVPVT